MHERRGASDFEIEKLDRVIAQSAQHEDTLWGSPRGEGIVPSLTRLTTEMTKFADVVTTLTTRMLGEDGIAADIKAMKLEMLMLQNDLEKKHKENEKRQDRQRAWLIGFGATFGPGLAWLIYRSVIIAIQGHL